MAEAEKQSSTRAYKLTSELYEPSDDDRETGPVNTKQRKADMVKLYRTFAERMYRARVEINGFSQQHAAKLLGYKNSSPLAKIEQGGKYPLWLPAVAARIYRVSADYLMGLCDFEYEMNQRGSDWEQAIINANKANIQILMAEHSKYLHKIAKTTQVTVCGLGDVLDRASDVKEMFDRVRELNPELWEEARGGSRLEGAVERLHEASKAVRRDADRARISLTAHACNGGVGQMVINDLDRYSKG